MNQARQEAFARTRLAFDEHRRQAASIMLPFEESHDLVPDRLNPGTLTQKVGKVLHGRQPSYPAGQHGVQLLTSASSVDEHDHHNTLFLFDFPDGIEIAW